MIRTAFAWVLWWLAAFWLWMLLAGDWNRIEWIAGACAATVTATIAELARAAGEVHARVPLAWLVKVWTVPPVVFADFGILAWALAESLVRRRVRRGVFRALPFRAEGDAPTARGIRAWATLVATYSPNAYVVDIDPDQSLALVHDLVPWRRSESPL